MFSDTTPVVSGDGKFFLGITEAFDGARLAGVELYVSTVSSSGIVRCQMRNVTAAVDMLSTRVQIDAGDTFSKDSATQPVVNESNAGVSWGDLIAIDVDDAGTDAMGLGWVPTFE